MKALLTLSLLLASSPAFAFSSELLTKVLQDQKVMTELNGRNIESISSGPSYRCFGCSGLIFKVVGSGEELFDTYNVQIMELPGRFTVNIGKIKEAQPE